MLTRLEAALRYLARGRSVIPVGPDKRPLVEWAGYQERRPTEAEVKVWWGKWPTANIAVITGPISGGLAVLDVDDVILAERMASDGALMAQTAAVRTPSGGLHIYVRETDTQSASGPLVSLVADLKASGGYVLVPPSQTPNGRYVPLRAGTPLRVPNARAWAIALLAAYGVDVPPENEHKPLSIAETLGTMAPGNRNVSLFKSACKLKAVGLGDADIAAFVRQTGRDQGLPDSEITGIIKSVARYPDGHPPTLEPHKGAEVGLTLPVVSLEILRQRHSGEVEWIVDGYMARGEVGFLAGAGESFKSWMAAHLAAAIDGGFKWLGVFEVKAERVLYIEQERAGNLVYQLNRIEAGEGVALGSDRLQIVPPCPLPLSEFDGQAALENATIAHKPDVVVINALRDVLGRANENSPTDIAALLGPLGRMAESHGCCILIIDHFNKAGMHGLVRGTAAHGGTAQKYNEADFVLIAERPRDEVGKGTGPATVSVSKRRSGDPGSAFAVDVTEGQQGCLVRATVGVKALSSAAQLVYHALGDGPALVADLSARLGKSKDTVKQAIAELRATELVDGEGPPGRAHTYRRTDLPTREPLYESRVGQGADLPPTPDPW